MKKFEGTGKVKSGALEIYPKVKVPACNLLQNNDQSTFWHNWRCMLLNIL